MDHIGIFEGIGGFSLAAQWIGWNTVAWCEINPFCQQILKYHFPNAKGHSDIRETDFSIYRGLIDIVTGGFPCQPYSLAGKRKGTEDDRHLWPEMLRAIREIQPGWVVGENVHGIVNWSGGMVFEQVQTDMENEGYDTQAYILPACAKDAPHRRDRVWFVAHSEKTECRNAMRTRAGWNGFAGMGNVRNATNTGNKGLQGSKINGSTTEIGENGNELFTGLFQSAWEKFPTQPPLCSRNDGLSPKLAGITFYKHRQESIKAYGNAIVPQVAYQIFKSIAEYESLIN